MDRNCLKCPFCGAPLPLKPVKGAYICSYCGSAVKTTDVNKDNEKNRSLVLLIKAFLENGGKSILEAIGFAIMMISILIYAMVLYHI